MHKVKLREKFSPWENSKFRFYSGIITGILYALTFYFLLYCTRETLRIFTITDHNDLWIFSAKEIQFYNLFFAFLSSILGQSICFSIWLEKPRTINKRNHRRILTILIDHKVLMWFFLAWFSKLAIGYVLLFTGSYTTADFYIFSFYPKYKYLFVLIIIVLFLQTWGGFLLKYKKNGFKWMFIFAILVSLFAFTISKINILDYKKLNTYILNKNIYNKYDLRLPKSKFYNVGRRRDSFEQLYMIQPSSSESSEPFFIMNRKEFSFSSLPSNILEEKLKKPQELRNIMIFQLNITPSIKMDYVETLKEDLAFLGISRLHFAVVPKDHKLDEKYYLNNYFSIANQSYFRHLNKTEKNQFKIQVEFLNHKSYMVNNDIIPSNELKNHISKLIIDHPQNLIMISIDPQLSFEKYFFMIKNTYEPILELRDSYSHKLYGSSFEDLDLNRKKEIIGKYSLKITEIRKGDFHFLENYYKNHPLKIQLNN